MNQIIEEVIEYLKSWDMKPTKENIKKVLEKWIENLYSHVGIESHKHSVACGVVDKTEMSLHEQDMYMLQQINKYKRCLIELEQ